MDIFHSDIFKRVEKVSSYSGPKIFSKSICHFVGIYDDTVIILSIIRFV